MLPTGSRTMLNKLMYGILGSWVIRKAGYDAALFLTGHATPPICPRISTRFQGSGTNKPLPRRSMTMAFASKLWPDLIMQPQPVSDVKPF